MKKLYHKKHGWLTVKGERYSPVGNRIVTMAVDSKGTERELDGTEITKEEYDKQQEELQNLETKTQKNESFDESLRTVFSHMKLVKGAKGDPGKDGKTPVSGVDYYSKNQVELMVRSLHEGTTKEVIQKLVDDIRPIKGKDYFDGKDGYTPVYGKDYFTKKDINSFISEIVTSVQKTIRNGKDGKEGKEGKSLQFKWEGTKLYIKKEGEEWGEGKDLKGLDGLNGGGGGIHKIEDATDVSTKNVVIGNALVWNGSQWVPGEAGAVESVNGQTGVVVLDYEDVGAEPTKGEDDNYVTDAEKIVIGNTSGENTGDETETTIKTKLGITTISGSNTGDETSASIIALLAGRNIITVGFDSSCDYVCDGTDDQVQINAAILACAGGGIIFIKKGTYIVNNLNKITTGIELYGEGKGNTIIKLKDSATVTAGVITIDDYADSVHIHDITVDGNMANNVDIATDGIYGKSTSNTNIHDVEVKNASFRGINLGNDGTITTSDFIISNNVINNIGQGGIQVSHGLNGKILNNTVYSTGFFGIGTYSADPTSYHNKNIVISGNYVDKSTPPTRVKGGIAEAGALIFLYYSDENIVVDSNICFDNRNAEEDGIQAVSNPAYPQYSNIIISNNIVNYAGGYGIDADSNYIVEGNQVNWSRWDGIFVGNDTQSEIKNVIVRNNILKNTNDDLGHWGYAGILISNEQTSSLISDVLISGNIVLDERETKKTLFGVYLNGDKATYSRIIISENDFYNVEGNASADAIRFYGDQTKFSDIRCINNIRKTPITIITGATPSILGNTSFKTNNSTPATITNFVGGFIGEELTLIFGDDNTTIENGTYIVMNSPITGITGNSIKFVYSSDSKWHEISRSQFIKAVKSEVFAGTDDTKYLTPLTVAELNKLPNGSILNGKIVPSVSSNNITLALKGKDGANPSATNPIYAMINGTLRSITVALSITLNAGTNWFNAGAAVLATQEIDYFAYLGYNDTDGVTIGFSRIPYAQQYSDFSATNTNEQYAAISTISNAAAGDQYENIGRFSAILSASASYNWSVPTFSGKNLIQKPIYETRNLKFVPSAVYSGGTADPTNVTAYGRYKIEYTKITAWISLSTTDPSTGVRTGVSFTIPMAVTLVQCPVSSYELYNSLQAVRAARAYSSTIAVYSIAPTTATAWELRLSVNYPIMTL